MVKTILVVDDSPVSRKIMMSSLPKDQDYTVYEASDGRMAIEVFREKSPDVVFMDITMPVMGGLQSLEEIIQIDKNAVIIMCTADIQPKTLERATALGAIAFINKPASKEKVYEALAKADQIIRGRASHQ